MADFRAVYAVCESVVEMLERQYDPSDFGGLSLEFRIASPGNPQQTPKAGVSLFLYRVVPSSAHRNPSGRVLPNGDRNLPQLPVDLQFLLTAWAQDHSAQHTIAGWMMRMMEDRPILSFGLLDSVVPGVFRPDESVEISLGDMSNEDMFRIWETMTENTYQLSVPYVARNVWIESSVAVTAGPAVQVRGFDHHAIEDAT